ncbi:MAG: DUF2336 domain-containing protein [Caulobacteraceae bacterium]
MTVVEEAQTLLELAKAKTPGDRGRLLMAVADLCDSARSAGALDARSLQALLSDIFMALVVQAEHDIRRRLAEKLAHADWAPPALINVLSLDEIEIAKPIIAASPILQDRDLIRLLVEASIEHQIEVARRPCLSTIVVDAVLAQDEPAVLTALAGNETADITPVGMARLVEASRRNASIRAPLARHPALTDQLAQKLYLWVGQTLRKSLSSRFRIDPTAMDAALGESVREAFEGKVWGEPAKGAAAPSAEDLEMEQRLIDKLHGAGQLRCGYLLRALREGKLSLFENALGKLGGFSAEEVRRAVNAETPDMLALACASVGLDRSVFGTVLGLVRGLNHNRPGGDEESGLRAAEAFAAHPPMAAATVVRRAIAV